MSNGRLAMDCVFPRSLLIRFHQPFAYEDTHLAVPTLSQDSHAEVLAPRQHSRVYAASLCRQSAVMIIGTSPQRFGSTELKTLC